MKVMHKNIFNSRHTSTLNGFTIVETIVVIAIIGILATISVVSYSAWKRTSVEAQLRSDLSGAAAAMGDYQTFNERYPASVGDLTTFTASDGVTLTGGSLHGGAYCIMSENNDATIKYRIDSFINEAEEGTCSINDASNIALDFSQWTLAGGATYNSSTKVLSLGSSGSATSPLVHVHKPIAISINAEFYTSTSSPHANLTPSGGWHLGIRYYAADRVTLVENSSGYTSNGCAQPIPLNQWSTSPAPCSFSGGPNVEFISYFLYGSTSGYASPDLEVRAASLKTSY